MILGRENGTWKIDDVPGTDCKSVRLRTHDAMTRVYDEPGNLIEMHEQAGNFKEW